ncbi:hypothetical protein [Pseudomonas sp. Z3-8]|uniref:hypothetical protein n=1 Tax=Pseudomonas sp. Z3-8 TaxID=2817412 RepID=UPI003DA8E468
MRHDSRDHGVLLQFWLGGFLALCTDPHFLVAGASVTVSVTAPQFGRAAMALIGGMLMAKMAIFLGGFLALTLLIGVLATISPV